VSSAVRGDETPPARSASPYSPSLQSTAIGGVIRRSPAWLAAHQQTVNPEGYVPVVTFYAYTALIRAGRPHGRPGRQSLVSGSSSAPRIGGGARHRQADRRLLTPQQIGTGAPVLVGVALMLLLLYRSNGLFARRAAP
jgi:branched-chain amino acid transport system permease protein